MPYIGTPADTGGPANRSRGLMFAALGWLVVTILWVNLWNTTFIAPVMGLAVGAAIVGLYCRGAGRLGTGDLRLVVGLVAGGLLAAFSVGMLADALDYFATQLETTVLAAATSPDFWKFFQDNLANPELMRPYLFDLLGAALGAAAAAWAAVKKFRS